MNIKKNVISVIVTVYNMEQFLEQCLESIINQDYDSLEIIVVDDGSTDNSGAICDAFAKQDNRIKVIHKENGGLVRARKTGLELATGTYVMFIDSDDYVESDFCSTMEKYMTESGADLYHANIYKNDEMHKGINCDYLYDFTEENRHSFLGVNVFGDNTKTTMAKNQIYPGVCLKIFKRELIEKYYNNVPDSQSFGEDLICFIHILQNCSKMGVTKRAFYHYRIREDSMSHENGIVMAVEATKLYEHIKRIFDEYQYPKSVHDSLNEYYKNTMLVRLLGEAQYKKIKRQYYLSNISYLMYKKIILYGAGNVGFDLYAQLCKYENIKILDWVDKNCERILCEYRKIKDLSRLAFLDYDIILVAVANEKVFDSITSDLVSRGIEKSKIIWSNPQWR